MVANLHMGREGRRRDGWTNHTQMGVVCTFHPSISRWRKEYQEFQVSYIVTLAGLYETLFKQTNKKKKRKTNLCFQSHPIYNTHFIYSIRYGKREYN